ncbi:MAG TPA: phosphodiester glycosidase family protein, partial [Acidimicrobiales bacterium]
MKKLRYAAAVSTAALLLCGTAQAASAAPAASAGQQAQQQQSSSGPAAAGGTSWLPTTPPNWPLVVDYSRTTQNELTRGVDQYSETYDTVAGRQHIQVLTADLADPNVRTGVVEADDKIIVPSDETTSSMAVRTGAVAGVNGGYFDINATGQPLGGVISDGTILKSPTPDFDAQLGVRPDGSIVMGQENFSGTVTDGTQSYPLTSVNTEGDEAAGKITELTSYLGAASGLTAGTLVLGTATDAAQDAFTVASVQTGVTSVPQLAQGEVGLMASGAGGQWLAGGVHVGDAVGLADQISPDNDLTQLIGGVDMLVKDGQIFDDPTGTPPSGVNPETAIGISEDGKHVIAVAIDGHEPENTAVGVSPAEVAGYMVAHGAYTAELFDGGGSTTEVGREPGAATASVLNTPSDQPGNIERPVADGLFFYSTQSQAGPAVKTVINGGAPVTTVAGGSIPVPAYATDSLGNPATGEPAVRVEPPSLATWANGNLTALRSGTGVLVASDGRAQSIEKLDVVPRLASLSVSPTDPDVGNAGTQQLTLSGTDPSGHGVEVPDAAATWQVGPS